MKRGFLAKIFLSTVLALGIPGLPHAQESAPPNADAKTLFFKIAQDVAPTGEVTYFDDGAVHAVTYYHDGAYDPRVLADVNVLLQDRDSNPAASASMDPGLLDLLYNIKTREEARHPGLSLVFHVISGYRSPATNARLRQDKDNPYHSAVAANSQHMQAKAIDIFVPEISGEELRDTAFCLQKGGVGWYAQFKDEFPYRYIHVDTGQVRHWGFDPRTIHCR